MSYFTNYNTYVILTITTLIFVLTAVTVNNKVTFPTDRKTRPIVTSKLRFIIRATLIYSFTVHMMHANIEYKSRDTVKDPTLRHLFRNHQILLIGVKGTQLCLCYSYHHKHWILSLAYRHITVQYSRFNLINMIKVLFEQAFKLSSFK